MKKRTLRAVALAVVACAALAVAIVRLSPGPEPSYDLVARSDRERSSGEFINAQRAAGYYQQEIKDHPSVVKNYVRLAQLFLQEARVTGRHHEYIPKAVRLLDEALRISPEDLEANLTRASILMTLHHFADARAIAEREVARNPYDAFAYGVLTDALVELGDYERAVRTCDKMLSIRPDIRSYARASYLRELHGDVDGAIAAMKDACDAGMSGQENRAWALYMLGMLHLEEGKPDTARYIFSGILEERPEYAYAYSGLARIEAAEGKADTAACLLARAAEIAPEHLFLEQLSDLYACTGRTSDARGIARIALASFAQHEKDGYNVDREEALFCANQGIDLQEALSRARRDYESRPGNIDALDTYAWALYKTGSAKAAVPFIEQALRLGTHSSDMHYHAALIYKTLGDMDRSSMHMREALRGRFWLNPLYAADIDSQVAAHGALAANDR